ncbi:NAD(P)H-flavin reductase [Motiliproteus sp. MSK22-1]|uniref:NAD(P)H-flavin reductase n=1 Tax=Motiliproteus sp. MSK22-1 TaxID=1897630 RepID=UPI0009F90374|nr:NAD(P)H-flavin reductase [Motiliproteus sp. MSK22-1]
MSANSSCAAENTEKTMSHWPQLTCTCQVLGVKLLGASVYEVRLALPELGEELGFHAGQYLELVLEDGKAVPYSIASAPKKDEIELHILNQEGGLSEKVLELFNSQPAVQVRMAMGECILYPDHLDAREELLFVAAATGFGQMKAMIEHALDEGVKNPIHLYWGVRAQEQFYLKYLAESWANEHPQVHFVPVVSEELENWEGRSGFVHTAVIEDFDSLDNVRAYVCGSPQMVYAVEDAFLEHGLKEGRIFSDVFAYAPRSA